MAAERRADDPERMTQGARRAFALLAVLMLVTGVAAVLSSIAYANYTVAQLRSQQLAGCAFAAHLGSAALPDRPRPGRLGVQLVTDSRAQWRALHCPGSLPPGTGLVKWAHFYRLPAG